MGDSSDPREELLRLASLDFVLQEPVEEVSVAEVIVRCLLEPKLQALQHARQAQAQRPHGVVSAVGRGGGAVSSVVERTPGPSSSRPSPHSRFSCRRIQHLITSRLGKVVVYRFDINVSHLYCQYRPAFLNMGLTIPVTVGKIR